MSKQSPPMLESISVEKSYTLAEYLELDQVAEGRLEYLHGHIYAMSGGTKKHNRLGRKLANFLEAATENDPCEVHTEGIKLQLSDQVHVYPDVMLTCDPADLVDERRVRKPILIAEVLSPSTEKRDRGEKFEAYLNIKGLKYYLLLSQEKDQIELFTKLEKGWHYQRLETQDEVLFFTEWDLELSLNDLYSA